MPVDKSFKQPPRKERRFTKKDWDEIRFSFATSLMVDTSIMALAQNLEADPWPVKGEGETPSKYIDLTWEELNGLPVMAGRPERVDHLIQILRETQSFDDPFGDMVATVDAAASKDDTLTKNLDYLGIPKDFPLRLCGLSPETLEFCEAEDIQTLGNFARFSQKMAQNVIVGGDFKGMLNAITMMDEQSLPKYIPFRAGQKGLHFAEAVGLLLNQLSENEKVSLLKRYGFKLTEKEAAKARLNRDQINRLEDIIIERIQELAGFFPEEIEEMFKGLQRGLKLERYFMVINDPEKEAICVPLAKRYLEQESAAIRARLREEAKPGFFARLFGRR